MKKVAVICSVIICALGLSSCDKNSREFKALQAERDSLALINEQVKTEYDQALMLINEVEENFRSIKDKENYLSVQSATTGELTPSVRERVQSDMQFVTETLEKNRQRIAELEKRLKASNLNSTQLSATLDNLRKDLEQKTMALVAMSEALEEKDREISELTANVTSLSTDVRDLRAQTNALEEEVSELKAVYYCFGTSRELKAQHILDGDEVSTAFNRDYFIKVRDYEKLTNIPLFAKKGRLISKHPAGSYEIVKDSNKQVELIILDPESFWSLTKYLVVLVNV